MMMNRDGSMKFLGLGLVVIAWFTFSIAANTEAKDVDAAKREAPEEAQSLAKHSQNPVADLTARNGE